MRSLALSSTLTVTVVSGIGTWTFVQVPVFAAHRMFPRTHPTVLSQSNAKDRPFNAPVVLNTN